MNFKSNITPLDKNIIIKNVKDNLFDKNVLNLIVDVGYVSIKFIPDGYEIKIIQESQEAIDIVEYFRDRFKRIPGRFKFLSYNINKNINKSNVIFYYKYNLLERVRFIGRSTS